MNIRCLFGKHTWNGCICKVCGTRRNQDHRWQGCKCTVCNAVRDQDHEWETVRKICDDCSYQPRSVEDLTGSLCYEANGCVCSRCKRCGKQTEWERF